MGDWIVDLKRRPQHLIDAEKKKERDRRLALDEPSQTVRDNFHGPAWPAEAIYWEPGSRSCEKCGALFHIPVFKEGKEGSEQPSCWCWEQKK